LHDYMGVRRANPARLIFLEGLKDFSQTVIRQEAASAAYETCDQKSCSTGCPNTTPFVLGIASDYHRLRSTSRVSSTSTGAGPSAVIPWVDRQFSLRYSAWCQNAVSCFGFGETNIACRAGVRELPQNLCMMASSRGGLPGISPRQPVRGQTDSHGPKSNVASSVDQAGLL